MSDAIVSYRVVVAAPVEQVGRHDGGDGSNARGNAQRSYLLFFVLFFLLLTAMISRQRKREETRARARASAARCERGDADEERRSPR